MPARHLLGGPARRHLPPPGRALRVGPDGDRHERSANEAADAVTRGLSTALAYGDPRVTPESVPSVDGPLAPATIDRTLARTGQPLPPDVRSEMEGHFNHDFSRVRVHTGPNADLSTAELRADAYTVGNNIAFGSGRYAPSTAAGRRLLAHELAHVVQRSPMVRPYRSRKGAFNFGRLDDAHLKEDSFDPRTDKNTKPWIEEVSVLFTAQGADLNSVDAWTGTATARYFDNPVKLADFTFPVMGGSSQLGLTDEGSSFLVHRIEGVGYNSGTFSGAPGVDFDPMNREGPKKRYSKDLSANMSFAVFYNRGEAFHAGPIAESSHGCVHVDWSSLDTIKQLNYHSVIGHTRVVVEYP
jgi:hypothetical protein